VQLKNKLTIPLMVLCLLSGLEREREKTPPHFPSAMSYFRSLKKVISSKKVLYPEECYHTCFSFCDKASKYFCQMMSILMSQLSNSAKALCIKQVKLPSLGNINHQMMAAKAQP